MRFLPAILALVALLCLIRSYRHADYAEITIGSKSFSLGSDWGAIVFKALDFPDTTGIFTNRASEVATLESEAGMTVNRWYPLRVWSDPAGLFVVVPYWVLLASMAVAWLVLRRCQAGTRGSEAARSKRGFRCMPDSLPASGDR